MRAEFINGRILERPFYKTNYGFAFANCKRESCYICRYKAPEKAADLLIGDYWGLDQNFPGYNKWGVSMILVNTPKGQELIGGLSGFRLIETDAEYVLSKNKMILSSKKKADRSDRFSKLLAEYDLDTACKRTKNLIV